MQKTKSVHRKERASLQRYATQEMLQSLLEPDEQLIWWDRPALRRIKEPFTIWDTITILFWSCAGYAFFIWDFKYFGWVDWYDRFRVLWGYFAFLLISGHLRLYKHGLLKALRKVRYRKYTYYVITNARALIVVHPKSTKPIMLTYTPQEITALKPQVNPDGSGTLFFGEAQKPRIGRFGPWVTIAGGFYGIRDVREAERLLQFLREAAIAMSQEREKTEDRHG